MLEDTFCSARQDLIDQRLAALERGEARDLLAKILNRERPHRTSCIGVDWDFQSDDLLEIVDVRASPHHHLHIFNVYDLFEVYRRSRASSHLSSDL